MATDEKAVEKSIFKLILAEKLGKQMYIKFVINVVSL